MSTRAFGADHTDTNTYLPRLLGTRRAITAEHYLSAQAGSHSPWHATGFPYIVV